MQTKRYLCFVVIAIIAVASSMSIMIYRALLLAGAVLVSISGGEHEDATAGGVHAMRAAARALHGATYNEHVYGRANTADVVIVVLVNRDVDALEGLLGSMQRVHDIHKALLVFSHSYYDDTINRLVRDVTYCRTMQLFYPHSIQLHPGRFPGPSARDCGVPGADPGDCSTRDAGRCERKHHWWWTARYTFELVPAAASSDASVVFLSERHLVSPDLLLVERAARAARALFPQVDLVALGRPGARHSDLALLAVEVWRPTFSAGLVVDRSLWIRINELASCFCTFDDTSWSHSLQAVFMRFPSGRVWALTALRGRVWVGGTAGGGGGGADNVLRPWWRSGRLRAVVTWPHYLRPTPLTATGMATPASAGGWADLRDQLFCIDPLHPIKIDVMEYDSMLSSLYQYSDYKINTSVANTY